MKKKLVSAVLCTAMLTTILAGCGGEAAPAATEPAAEAPAAEESAGEASAAEGEAPHAGRHPAPGIPKQFLLPGMRGPPVFCL